MATWLMVTLIVSVVFGLCCYFRVHIKIYDQSKEVHPQIKQEEILPAEDSWEKDWLETHRNQHQVVKIESTKLVFKFVKKEDQKPIDGFAVHCSCGSKDIFGLNLSLAKTDYERHLKKEGEKALAAINKFEMPANVNWSAEVERRMN